MRCSSRPAYDAFIHEFNTERPHEALDMQPPAERYWPSTRPYAGLPELSYPLHDKQHMITACGRVCDDAIWLGSFMHYDLGCIDLEQKTLQPIDNPFGTRLSPMS